MTESSKGFNRILSDFKKTNHLFTGRATAGLYLILKARRIENSGVVCPANICHSIVNAVLLSGNRPVFADVDPDDGNTRLEFLAEKWAEDTAVLLVPHMFGNPCVDMERISAFCRKKNILLIEDCAVCIGGGAGGRHPGEHGDYSLLSFGHNKIMDIGSGGMVLSNQPLEDLEELNTRLPEMSDEIREKTELYSKLFADVYHSGHLDELLPRLAAVNEYFQDTYLFRESAERLNTLHGEMENLGSNLESRRAIADYYSTAIDFTGDVTRYPYRNGAVFWRFNILVHHPVSRRRIIEKLLENHIPVSIWSPPINKLFGDVGTYGNADRFSKRILNLPVTVDARTAEKAVESIENARKSS